MKRSQKSIYSVSALALFVTLGLAGCPQDSKEEAKAPPAEPAAAATQPAAPAAPAGEPGTLAAPATTAVSPPAAAAAAEALKPDPSKAAEK